MKALVFMAATADLMIRVEVPDGLDPEEARDAAIDAAYAQMPRSLCAHCGGWGQSWSLDLGEFETVEHNPVEIEGEPAASPSNSSPEAS